MKYVALGDSYAAGTGTVSLDPSEPACARSTHNYPSLIESALGVTNVDVTCANAETRHFTTAQHPMGAGPQLDAVTADTDLVTVTIGGNDNATFNTALADAAAASGVTFVDMLGPSTGHDPCKAIGTRWVEPAIFGLNFIPAHPNWLGSEAVAAETLEALGLA